MGTNFSKSATFVTCEAAAVPPPPPPLLPPGTNLQAPPPPPPPGAAATNADATASGDGGKQIEREDSASSNTIANTTQNTESSSSSSIPNPGPYEAATIACKRLTNIDTHSGFKCDIQKQLSPYMVAIHSFHLGTSLPDGRNKAYMFITQVADEEGLFMTNVDPEKKTVNGRVHRSLLGGLAMGKVQCSVSPDGSNDQLLGELDFGGMTWTGNFKYGSMGGGPIVGMNYYQSVTRRLAMGGEGMYIAANGNMLSSYTVKYECDAPSDPSVAASATGGSGSGSGNDLEENHQVGFVHNFIQHRAC
jgi:U5 snRNP spliceosome subunit